MLEETVYLLIYFPQKSKYWQVLQKETTEEAIQGRDTFHFKEDKLWDGKGDRVAEMHAMFKQIEYQLSCLEKIYNLSVSWNL